MKPPPFLYSTKIYHLNFAQSLLEMRRSKSLQLTLSKIKRGRYHILNFGYRISLLTSKSGEYLYRQQSNRFIPYVTKETTQVGLAHESYVLLEKNGGM